MANIEEYIAKIQEAGLDWKTVAQIANALKEKEEQEQKPAETKTLTVNTNTISYTVQISYPDLILEKTKGASTSRAIICVSQHSYYVQTAKKITPLSQTVWADFTSGMQPIDLQDYWIPCLMSGQRFYKIVDMLLSDPEIREAIKKGVYPSDVTLIRKDLESRSSWEVDEIIRCYRETAAVYADLKPIYKDLLNSTFPAKENTTFLGSLYFILYKYGPEKARDFIRSCGQSLIDWGNRGGYYDDGFDFYAPKELGDRGRFPHERDVQFRTFMKIDGVIKGKKRYYFRIPLIEMEYEKLRDYILYDAYHMGFSSIHTFLREWNDTLQNEELAWGKIREKYPVHLQEYHDIAARTALLVKQMQETEGFIEHAAAIKDQFETTIGDYVFIVPKKPEDMLDEATQQANCLAGYVSKFAASETNIIFMRRKDDPDKSVVTIEVLGNDINQAYEAHNRWPNQEHTEIIRKYAKKIGVQYDR